MRGKYFLPSRLLPLLADPSANSSPDQHALTERELQVVCEIARGRTYRERATEKLWCPGPWPKGSKFPSSGGVPEGRGGSTDFVTELEPRRSRAGHAGS